ncbi:FAS1 domain-containing protein [Peniophora sp. CONT]|nr:FAS1 domain-containing protein [Peniophora sp. CONT]
MRRLFTFALLPLACASAAQVHFDSPATAPFDGPVRTTSTTLVDVLSNDSDYTSLLRLLQRAKLIPTLNRLNGSTFFAPTNDAIEKHKASNSLWHAALSDDSHLLDNVHEQLRQDLLYHLLNYSISLPQEERLLVTHTLHFPYEHTEPPTREPPGRPPWMPQPGGTLGGEPQRLRVAARESAVYVGVDTFGKGGAKLVKGEVNAGNGILLGIDSVLAPPSHLADIIGNQSSLSYFQRILTPEVKDRLANTSELTLFVPVDSAFDALPKYERLYLESDFATDDLQRIFEMHAVVQDRVVYSEAFEPAVNLTTLQGQTLEVVRAPDKVLVSDAEIVQSDIYAANGVLHTVSSLLVPEGALRLTPEKLLLTYNCTTFISLLHSVNLTSLVNNTDAKYTILAPPDDVMTLFGGDDLPEKGSEELQKLLQYHFLPGRWTSKKLRDATLVETELTEDGLDDGRQVVEVEVTDKSKAEAGSSDVIRFAGAAVVGEPLPLDNVIIYFLSRPIIPPADSLAVALPSLDLSAFLAAVFSADLQDVLKTAVRSTLLIPHNEAFKRLGALVSSHLLSTAGKADLKNTILHHTLDGVFYANELANGSTRTFGTLEGSDVSLTRASNGSLSLSGSGGWRGMSSAVWLRNTLSRTGVVHELSDVLLPRTVELTVGKLVKAAAGSTMANLITRAGMDWVLNGTAPPEDSPWAGVKGTGWTLLCPNDDAFKNVNLTTLYKDTNVLQAIVAQHLISTPPPADDMPRDDRPLPLEDKEGHATLLSPKHDYGDVVFRKDGEQLLVGIRDARGTSARNDWARVMAWGRATTGPGGGSGGVVQIDRLLMPYNAPWWWAYGAPVAVGVLGLVLIAGFFALVRIVWRRDTTEATYEPVGGFIEDEDDAEV